MVLCHGKSRGQGTSMSFHQPHHSLKWHKQTNNSTKETGHRESRHDYNPAENSHDTKIMRRNKRKR